MLRLPHTDAHPTHGRLGPLTMLPYFTILVTARSQTEEAGASSEELLFSFLLLPTGIEGAMPTAVSPRRKLAN